MKITKDTRLFLHPVSLDIAAHFISTAAFALWIFLRTANLFYAAIVVAGGIFIDLDHLVDYFIFFGRRFRINDFFDSVYLKSGKVYIFLHSWEIICVLLAVSLGTKSPELLLLSLSLSLHVAIDNVQRRKPLFYFLIYRFSKQFDVDVLLPEFKDFLAARAQAV